MKRISSVIGLSLFSLLLLSQPQNANASPSNVGPPLGAILDLAGTPIPGVYTHYTVDFVAGATSTDLTFALRHDPGFLLLDDISLTDLTVPSGELVTNGGFETGDLTGWTDDNIYGAAFPGQVNQTGYGCPTGAHTGTWEWCDGSVQAYDAIDQMIATTMGDTYHVSFWLDNNGSVNGDVNFQQLSTNGNVTDTGGNGIDLLVYAQAQLPQPAPEPASMVLLGTGLVGLGILRRRQS